MRPYTLRLHYHGRRPRIFFALGKGIGSVIASKSIAALLAILAWILPAVVGAASVTYRTQHSNGVTVAAGVTTDWGTCGSKPTTTRTTLLSTAAFDCADDEVNATGITTHFEAISTTAYAQNTNVTGTSCGGCGRGERQRQHDRRQESERREQLNLAASKVWVLL